MSRTSLRLTLVGTSPLLMHASALLDPINPIAVELETYHEKPAKSAADHRRIADLQFAGALWHIEGRPCLPARTMQAVIREAADRRGASHRVRSSIIVEDDAPLDYDGPASLAGLIQDPAFRTRSPVTFEDGQRRMCTRPFFSRWAATIVVGYDPSVLARADLIDLVIMAGDDIGIGAGRPKFGRFSVAPAAE